MQKTYWEVQTQKGFNYAIMAIWKERIVTDSGYKKAKNIMLSNNII
jgi:hypothetical protein